MSPLAEIQLLTARELRKTFRSTKGVVLAALSLAGGAGAAMLVVSLDRFQREQLPAQVDVAALQQQAYSRIYDAETAKALVHCPYPLWMMLGASLWLGPLLVALMAFDAVSADLQHRSVRYWAARGRRASYIVGKFLGACVAVLGVTLAMNVVVWVVTARTGGFPVADVLVWGLRFFAVTIPITAAWCAIATLVGSQFKSPMLALLVICTSFFALWLVRVEAVLGDLPALLYLYPSSYDRFLLSPRPGDVARGLAGTGAIAALAVSASVGLFERRDL